MSDFATEGPSYDMPAPARPPATEPATPGRATGTAPPAASRTRAVEIAPDLHDHTTPPAFRAEVDVELRTLVAHVRRNVELHTAASTHPDREAALEALDTRVELALQHVPAEQHRALVVGLRGSLAAAEVAALEHVLAGATEHGGRAATLLGIERAAPVVASPIQRFANGQGDGSAIHAHAARGIAGASSTLPHAAAIQAAFGHHDISGVRAQVGGAAAEASQAIGAHAYASGDAVAFASAPDLRLAAHEAAHVVQQRGGVRLSGGVGAAGDPYEQHADAVADLVVRGDSAQGLLDQMAHRGSAGGPAVQRWLRDDQPYALRVDEVRASLERQRADMRASGDFTRAGEVEGALRELDRAGTTIDEAMLARIRGTCDAVRSGGSTAVSDVGLDRVSVRSGIGSGDGDVTATMTVTQSGAGGLVTVRAGESSGSLGGSVSTQSGADGVHGADVAVGGSARRFRTAEQVSVSLAGGGQFYAAIPQHQADGTWQVSWRLSIHGGLGGSMGSASHEAAPEGGDPVAARSTVAVGGSFDVERAREGTSVFATREEAEAFRTTFRTTDVAALAARVEACASDLATPADWATAPVGTERSYAAGYSLGPQMSAIVGGLVSVGAGITWHTVGTTVVTKLDATHVRVRVVATSSQTLATSVGAAGVGVDGLGLVGLPTDQTHRVTTTFAIDLAAGTTALAAVLSSQGAPQGAGVTLVSVQDEQAVASDGGARLGPFARVAGGTTASEIATTTYGEDGTQATTLTHHTDERGGGTSMFGDYSRRRLAIDASEDGSLGATTDIHTTSGEESRDLLIGDTGWSHASDTPTPSGNWIIYEHFDRAQLVAFQSGLLAQRRPVEAVPNDPYPALYDALQPVPRDASGDAARARVLSDFLGATGRAGLMFIESHGASAPERSIRLFGREGRDQNFMSLAELAAQETRIASYRTCRDDVSTQIRADLATLEPRLRAVADPMRYTDLSDDMREEVCARYRGLIEQLRGLLAQRAADTPAPVETTTPDVEPIHAAVREQRRVLLERAARVRAAQEAAPVESSAEREALDARLDTATTAFEQAETAYARGEAAADPLAFEQARGRYGEAERALAGLEEGYRAL